MFTPIKKSTNRRLAAAFAVVAVLALGRGVVGAADPPAGGDAPALVRQIKVLPDKAPDCSSLKSIAETATRGCKTNDAKGVALYNFVLLTHYHFHSAIEDGGIPALKVINCYGWGLCGDTSAVLSALWRQLGWGWRFVCWPGHTTVEARYDGRLHYFDPFLKWYVWMPDGKGGMTVAGEEDILKNRKELWDDAFVFDPRRRVGYMKSDQFILVNGKANWRARDFMDCDAFWMMAKDANGQFKGAVPKQLNKVGPSESWAGYNHADGSYRTDVNLAPGFALTNTWDALPDAWYWRGSKTPPAHFCSGHVDTRNSPGLGLVLEPYIDSKPKRSYGNGHLTFTPDFSTDACLKSFLAAENVKRADKGLVPAEAGKPAVVVVQLSSPYIMTKASGEAAGAEKVEVSVDDGKTFKAIDLKGFDEAVKGRLAAQVRVTFGQALTSLRLEAVVQNNPGALPYLSPGRNTVTVSVANPEALGDNRLVVTYAYRLGARSLSFDEICQQGKCVANQVGAKWSDAVTCVQKTFTAKDLPATFTIDCPTPRGQYPVYPRMVLLRREVLAPSSSPSPLPEGAVEAKAGPTDELMTLPDPLLLGTEPPVAESVVRAEAEPGEAIVIQGKPAVADALIHFETPDRSYGAVPRDNALRRSDRTNAFLVKFDLAGKVPQGAKVASAKLTFYVWDPSSQGKTRVCAFRVASDWDERTVTWKQAAAGRPWAGEAGFEVGKDTAQDPDGEVIVPPEQGADTADPPLEYSIDVTQSVKSWLAGDAKNHGLAIAPMIDRSVDDGQWTRLQLYATEYNQKEFTPKLVIRLGR